VDWLLRILVQNGFRRGFRGEGPAWFVIGVSAWALNRARKNTDDVIYRTLLKPGEQLIVTRPPAKTSGRAGR
jgi:hypothetical protein